LQRMLILMSSSGRETEKKRTGKGREKGPRQIGVSTFPSNTSQPEKKERKRERRGKKKKKGERGGGVRDTRKT